MPKVQKKSTKKFEKNRLKPLLEKRKEFAKVKQRHHIKDRKKARRTQDAAAAAANRDGEGLGAKEKKKRDGELAKEKFEGMTVDEFFEGGFDIERDTKGPNGQKKGKTEKNLPGKKRKRDQEEAEDSGTASESEGDERVISGPVNGPSAPDEDSVDDDLAEGIGHKGDLENLQKKDPEFYKFLRENDAELLDFDANADLSGIDELSGDDKQEPAKKKKKGKKKVEEAKKDNNVTLAMVQRWQKSLIEQRSLRASREVVLAFRAAVHTNETDGKQHKYSISSPEVYHQLLRTSLIHLPGVIVHHLPGKEMPNGKVKIATDSKKYKTLSPLLNSHAASLTHLLETLSDEATLKLTLASIEPLLPYLLSFRKGLKGLVKTIVDIWSNTASSDATRINAFLNIRKLAVVGDAAIREALLKAAYTGLIKGSRNTSIHTITGINLMKNSAVDLWGIDYDLGYTTGFTYIRQLAIHLRTNLAHPTKDSYKMCYNWQYIHSLDFWSRVFSTHCSPASNPLLKKPTDCPLHPLIYPLVQVTLGALRLIPTPTYFPLRFQLTRSLLRISRSTTTYIPLAPSLLEVLHSPEVKNPPKPSTLKPLDFNITLRAPKQYSKTRVYQDGIMEQVSELLAEFFGVWAKSVAFPELVIPPVVMLKRWMKDVTNPNKRQTQHQPLSKKAKKNLKKPNPKITGPISLLIQKMNLNAEYVQRERRKVEFTPKDREQVEAFLREVKWENMPLGAFVEGLRKKREEREKLVEKGRREEEKRRKREREDDMEEEAEEMQVDEEVDSDEGTEGESESDNGGVVVKASDKGNMEGKVNGKVNGNPTEKTNGTRADPANEDEGDNGNENGDEASDEWDDDDDGIDELPDAEEGLIDDEVMEGDEDEENDDESDPEVMVF